MTPNQLMVAGIVSVALTLFAGVLMGAVQIIFPVPSWYLVLFVAATVVLLLAVLYGILVGVLSTWKGTPWQRSSLSRVQWSPLLPIRRRHT